jgi:TRAP-type C4-dicarboxylate transport system permease small subunit
MKNENNQGNVFLRFFQIILVILLLATVVLTLAQVFSRYVIQQNARGVEELARLSVVWISFLGASYAYIFEELITVDILTTRISNKKVLKALRLGIIIIVILVSLIMMYNGMSYVLRYWVFPDLSTSLLLPRSLFFLPIPISGIILFFASIVKIVETLKNKGEQE